jgi:outer membrane protein TolC
MLRLSLAVALSTATASADELAPSRIGFRDAVTRALAKNPSVALAQADLERARSLVREARSTSYPTLTGTAAYTRLDDERSSQGRVTLPRDQLNASLLLAVPIVAPRSWGTWSHAEDQVKVTESSLEETRRQVASATGRAYLTVLSQRRIIDATARARDTAKAHYDFAKQRLDGGVGTKLDLVRADQEVASAIAQLETAEVSLARAREALGVLVGTEAPLDAEDEPPLEGVPPLPQSLEAAAARADVRAARDRAWAADRVVKDNWREYSPTLSGFFQPFYQTPATLTTPTTGWQAQLVLSVPLYDGGLRYGLEGERAANAAAARTNLDATLRQTRSEVRASHESIRRADDALTAARRAATLAHEALDLAIVAFKGGASTNLEVIDAERRARDADTIVALAEDTSRQARLDLLVATGRFP